MVLPETFVAPALALLAVLVVVQFALIAGLSSRLGRLNRSLRTFFSTGTGENIEELLRSTLQQSNEAAQHSVTVQARIENLEAQIGTCLQHVGLVRYDAFGDVTGQQSFSLALLDGSNNGAILTALFARTNSRTYGKMIVAGQPQQQLTEEEQEALIQALSQKVGNR